MYSNAWACCPSIRECIAIDLWYCHSTRACGLDRSIQQPTIEALMERENAISTEHSATDMEKPSFKKTLPLSLKKQRFRDSISKNLAELTTPVVPENTRKNTTWALRNFRDWRAERAERYPEEVCPEDLLERRPWDIVGLNRWLSIFLHETRKSGGERYPFSSVYQMLSGILRHMRSIHPDCPNFMDKKDYRFKELHAAVDNLGRQLRSAGVGAEVKHVSVITADEEESLWENEVLGVHNPRALLAAVFYYNGKNFCLRGGIEHRRLKLSQLKRLYDPDRYVYVENGSKNHSGSLSERCIQNKSVPIFACFDEVGERCHVHLLDVYISRMPQKAKDLDYFYLRPLEKYSDEPSAPWYYSSPVGKHKLGSMVKEMFNEIGVAGKTNHSLRATGASTLFEAKIPEKVIQERTGHRSLKALRLYERTTDKQQQEISVILAKRPRDEETIAPVPQAVPLNPLPSSSAPFPTFGVLHHCTVNINYGNYGPSSVNMQLQHQPSTDD